MNQIKQKEYILGIHCGHDSTAVLMCEGEVVEAMSEERLSRYKKYIGFPYLSVAYIKNKYGISEFKDVVSVGVSDEIDFTISNEYNKKVRESGMATPQYFLRAIGDKFFVLGKVFTLRDQVFLYLSRRGLNNKNKAFLAKQFPSAKISYLDHHLAHTWATVPFISDHNKKHIMLTLDGTGDNLSGSISIYDKGEISRKHSFPTSASLGLLYCAITDILGMKRNEHEFKVMGLAPYAKASSGEKVYKELGKLVWFNEEKMVMESLIPLEKATSYLIANNFYQYRFDSLAYGIQKLTEEIIKKMAKASIVKYGISDLAIAGGVFMNVKANQYLRELPEVSNLVICPSGGDESLALGAVYFRYNEIHQNENNSAKNLRNLYLGSSYTEQEIKLAIDNNEFVKNCKVRYFDANSSETIEMKVAEILSQNSVVGRFKGRAEWGARALGNRSILANPTSRENVKLINEMIKGRDFWMPFATSMLYERRNDYLVDADSYLAPFMAITFETKELAHKELIAALHPYDLTSRPQMVQKETNPEYHNLISHFEKLTGVGGVLNTSFNLHGEPNVENPEDAIKTFVNSGLPHLAVGNYLISKQ